MNLDQLNQVQELTRYHLNSGFPFSVTPRNFIPEKKIKKVEKKPNAFRVYSHIFTKTMQMHDISLPQHPQQKHILRSVINSAWRNESVYTKQICQNISDEAYKELKYNPSFLI
ncbi:20374_t:CDS:1 [Funneliformis geosporum]|uniref:12575_t:CDS:1 n=1 Tax=Funneliformis geosporum TaxID=1117311 RepID=A0A9W4SMF1_9GLOM|nr:12575_t:CDS:1 [Funneliformis geosporum]CAI2181418.1 20374_t:CDS:1 [Funneliformis geosporum]